ncbi:hypothetical protein HNR73_002535 [Phytomonospora endophytica]|uniref:Uncharacterized protein n=1 Tax=Phytomonospora endophytica TaxID=714109 RepID=A0A841FBM4_9ACTN|nr:hypothetical protein [Phytomonospora endophytica]GIG69118.1 hypothetical protein Pen01_54130 [Phytomonospora endophytica]
MAAEAEVSGGGEVGGGVDVAAKAGPQAAEAFGARRAVGGGRAGTEARVEFGAFGGGEHDGPGAEGVGDERARETGGAAEGLGEFTGTQGGQVGGQDGEVGGRVGRAQPGRRVPDRRIEIGTRPLVQGVHSHPRDGFADRGIPGDGDDPRHRAAARGGVRRVEREGEREGLARHGHRRRPEPGLRRRQPLDRDQDGPVGHG